MAPPTQANGNNSPQAAIENQPEPLPVDPPPTPWRNSRAKKQLFVDFVKGRNKGKTSTQVYNSRPIYQRYNLKNFQSNYGTMKKAVQNKMEAATSSRRAYNHDIPIIRQRREQQSRFYYPDSAVQEKLRSDVRENRIGNKTPKEVLASRPVYTQLKLSLKQFANHIHYEKRLLERTLLMQAYKERMRFINAEINPDNHNDNGDE